MTYSLFKQTKLSQLIFLLFSAPAFAAGDGHSPSGFPIPLPSRVSIWASSGTNTFGEGDAMIPLWGNPKQIFFGDITGKYGDDRAWLASIGLGGRKVVRNNSILGAYFFTDYNKTPNANYFTILNPGVELMTNQWDAHLNGYIPVGQKSKLMGVFTGNQIGMPNTSFFRGHAQYDVLFDLLEDVGPGVDLEIGHTFNAFPYLKRTRVFAGGYYFTPKDTSNVSGVEVGFEMPLNFKWASVEVRDSYDNINHNTFLLTLRFTFGGLDKTREPDIHDRMLDRIPRHLGNFYNGDGIPSQKAIVNTGRTTVVKDNIWFFNPDTPSFTVLDQPTTFQSCTFEHPCIGLTQARIDQINALALRANFYLSPGTYNNPALGSGFNFHNGQDIFGRTSDFMQLATGNNRPLVNDSIILNGHSDIMNLRINGHSVQILETGGMQVPFEVGILTKTTSVGEINITNCDINQTSTTNNSVAIANNANGSFLNIFNTTMTSNVSNLAGSISVGVANLRSGGLNIHNSFITASNTDVTNNSSLVFGLVNNEVGIVDITNTSIIANLTHGGLLAGVLNNSTLGGGHGTITINGSTITANGNDASLVGGVFNQANNVEGDSANVDISQSTISVTSNNNGSATAAGVLTSGNGTMNINNSAINGTADSGNISGIVVGDATATANFQNTTISLNTSGTAVGTPTQNAGTLNDNGGNQCFENGVSVPC